MLNVFSPYDVLKVSEMPPSLMEEVNGEPLFTMHWESPTKKMESRSLTVFQVPLKYEASPFRKVNIPSLSKDGTIHVSLSGFFYILGSKHFNITAMFLACYDEIEFHVDYLSVDDLKPSNIINRVPFTQAVEGMKSQFAQSQKRYLSNEWDLVFTNLFHSLRMIEINCTGLSSIRYTRKYFEHEMMYTDFVDGLRKVHPILANFSVRDEEFYNSLFWDWFKRGLA